jgi:mitofusin
MISRISSLIPTEAKKASYNLDVKPRQNFEVFYRLNCESLCSDFQEDLEFRFSLGLISMIKRFSNKNPFRKDTVPRPMSSPSPMTDNSLMSDKAVTDNMMLVIVERFATSPQSQTTLGALALGGFMVRTIGWRVIGVTCGIYALLYLYERLTWTNKAKEHSFKKQYVNHATKKLKLIVDLTSANCSHQVQQELSSTFSRLCRLIEDLIKDMSVEINALDDEVERLQETATTAASLKDRANSLVDNLNGFSRRYLTMS